ncbi:restriction endonuclease subunit S [Lactococcus lactis]|uniref:restriction endonuclease subunit S n=1 Tax=Lactococcus lactis TaxID=1358 RepID=UPI00205ACCFB|nr:restriction endonuclease subunit S [Lactococcus lactis]BDH84051.1 restriction endonuclease [Lactococcus lactis]
MSENKKLIPKRRFKEFENADAWEQRELDILADFSKGSGYSKSDLVSTGEPVILYGRLYTNYETVIRDIDTFVNDISNSVLSKGGEVIVPSSGETAEDISRASVVDSTGIALGGDLNIIYPKAQIDSTFLALTISNGNQKKELSKRAQGKSVVHIRNEDLKKVLLVFPKKEEQKLIGRFFCSLDQTIAFQQRKLEKMKSMKSAYLSEMFPAEGERKPKRRFPGFTDDWEQRELGEIGEVTRTSINPNNYPNDEFIEYSMPAFDDGEKPQKVLGSTMLSSRLKLSGKSLLINKLNVRQQRIWLVNEAEGNAVASGEFLPYSSSEIDLSFLRQFMLSDKATQDLESISSGTSNSQKRISPNDFLKYQVMIPTKKEEQVRIGQFFSNLDQTIAFQQQKLEKLQNIKKAYLNEMFI